MAHHLTTLTFTTCDYKISASSLYSRVYLGEKHTGKAEGMSSSYMSQFLATSLPQVFSQEEPRQFGGDWFGGDW